MLLVLEHHVEHPKSNVPKFQHFSELSLEVQGGQAYFWFVEGTCIMSLCLSSLSLSLSLSLSMCVCVCVLSAAFRFWFSLQKLNSICF